MRFEQVATQRMGWSGGGGRETTQICAIVQIKRDHSCTKSVAAGLERIARIHHLSSLCFPI